MSESRRRRSSGNSKQSQRSGSSLNGGPADCMSNNGSSASRDSGRTKGSHYKGNYQRSTSYDKVRRLVKEEGRMARNLVTWNVPVDSDDSDNNEESTQRPPHSPHSRKQWDDVNKSRMSRKQHPLVTNKMRKKSQSLPSLDSPRDGKAGASAAGTGDVHTVHEKGSMTPGRKKAAATKKVDLRARYWAFLFDNLHRAVDEIYQTCEVDESIIECKEVIMILKIATLDFDSLIKRITVQKDFENADTQNRPTSIVWEVRKSTSSPSKHRSPSWPAEAKFQTRRRPTSLAWEVRKTSPGHTLGTSPTPDGYRSTPSPVNRSLNFGKAAHAMGKTSPVPVMNPGTSWADRVKGKKTVRPIATSPVKEEPAMQAPTPASQTQGTTALSPRDDKIPSVDGTHSEDADDEGWETVQRSKQNRSRPSSAKHSNNGRHHPSNTSNSVQTSTANGPVGSSSKAPQTHAPKAQGPGPLKPRERADSEKENRPDSRDQRNASSGGVVRQLMQERQNEPPLPSAVKTDIKEDDPSIIQATTSKGLHSSSDEDEHDDESEEVLAKKLDDDDDVENADTDLDEEETLTNELAKCQEEALARAIAEEESLNKEIQEEEQTEIVVETDDAESDLGNTMSSLECSQQATDWGEMAIDFEKRESEGATWSELVDIENQESVRTPGYALHMHEKLSSPSRKRTREESQKRHEERQKRAQNKRERMMEAKSGRLMMLHDKIEEVVEWKNELMKQKKKLLEEKQKKAEEKRLMQLQAVIRKAQDEEAKANEIAFINSLEAQIKKHDIMARHQGHEARYHDILEERQRKHEEKAAKEEAVQGRRKALEEERKARLEAMTKYRRDQEDKMNALKEQRERARESTVKEKAKEREQRLSALTAAQSAKEEEIQKKIQQKHDESQKRHTQQIEQKRERAIELSTLKHYRTSDLAPKQKPYEKKKMCNLCNVLIPSEVFLLSHLRGKKHREKVAENQGAGISEEELETYSLNLVVEAPGDQSHPEVVAERERQKASRKRARKLRQRMASKGKEYENNLPSKTQGQDSLHKAKLQKLLKDLNKYLQAQDTSGPWEQSKVSAIDRALGEVNRIMDKKEQTDQIMFRAHGGLSVLTRVLMLIDTASTEKSAVIPKKTLSSAADVFRLACRNNYDNCQYTMYSGKMGPLIDLLMHQLSILIPETEDGLHGHPWGPDSLKPPHDTVAGSLMLLLTSVLNTLVKHRPQSPSTPDGKLPSQAKKKQKETFDQWGMDVVSYLVSCGVLDKLTVYFNNVREPIDGERHIAEFLQHALGLLGAMTRFISTTLNRSSAGIFSPKKDDTTQLVGTFQATGLGGIVSLLYGILLHGGAPSRDSTMTPPEIPEHTLSVVNAGIKMLSNIATLDLQVLQAALGAEGTSLEFRHIASYLMWYCSHFTGCEDLLHEVILIVGYNTVLNMDNQILVQTGNTPTLLQQLCSLPFQFFSDPRLVNVLYPTLISCCYGNEENKKILQQEMSSSLLVTFLKERQKDQEQGKLTPTAAKAKEKEKEKEGASKFNLDYRFPDDRTQDALQFFKS